MNTRSLLRWASLACVFSFATAFFLNIKSAEEDKKDFPKGVTGILKGHTEPLYSVAFSPKGTHLATASFDKTVKLWEAATAAEIKTLAGASGHQNLVLSVTWSPDGQLIASGSQDNTAKIWEFPQKDPLREMSHGKPVTVLAMSPDGARLASADKEGKVKIWNSIDGKVLTNLEVGRGAIVDLAFSANGEILTTCCGGDSAFRLWNVADGKLLNTYYGHRKTVTGVALHPNNTTAYSVGEDGALRFWQLGVPPSRLISTHQGVTNALALSPDGSQVFSAGDDALVQINLVANGQTVGQLSGLPSSLQSLGLSPNGKIVAAGSVDGRLIFWNLDTRKIVFQAIAHKSAVQSISFHPSGNQILSQDTQGTLKLWAVPPLEEKTITFPTGIRFLTVLDDKNHLIAAGGDKVLRTWNLTTRQMEKQFAALPSPLTSLATRIDGQEIVSGQADGSIRFRNYGTGQENGFVGAHSGPVAALKTRPGSNQIASASADGTVKLWKKPGDVKTLLHTDRVTCMLAVPDKVHFLTGCQDKQVRLWNAVNGLAEKVFAGLSAAPDTLAWSEDGTLVGASSADRSLLVWDARTSKEIKRISQLPASIKALAFAPPQNILAACLEDGTVHFFELKGGTKVRSFGSKHAPVHSAIFTSKGEFLVTAAGDKKLRIWDGVKGTLVREISGKASFNVVSVNREGTLLATGNSDKTVQVFKLPKGDEVKQFSTPAEIRGLRWDERGGQIVIAGGDQRIRVYSREGTMLQFHVNEGPLTGVNIKGDAKVVLAYGDKSARILPLSLVWVTLTQGSVKQILFSPDGKRLFGIENEKTIHVWNSEDGKDVLFFQAHAGAVSAIALSPDGKKLVSIGTDKTLKIWELAGQGAGAEIVPRVANHTLGLAEVPSAIAISPDSKSVAVAMAANEGSRVAVFDLTTIQESVELVRSAGKIRNLSYLGDNKTLVVDDGSSTIRLEEIGFVRDFAEEAGASGGAVFHANGSQVLSGSKDATLKLWDLASGKKITLFGPAGDPVRAVAFSRDYSLVGRAAGKEVRVWNVDGRAVLSLPHPDNVLSLSFSFDKTKLVTGGADHFSRVWDLASGQLLQEFPQEGEVRSVVYCPNPQQICAGSADKTIGIHTLSAFRVVAASKLPLCALCLTSTGGQLLTGGDDTFVKSWNTSNGAMEKTFSGKAAVRRAAISPNGLTLAVADNERKIHVYQIADGKLLGKLATDGAIQDLRFSPSNQILAAACENNVLQTWDVTLAPAQAEGDFGKPLSSYIHAGAVTGLAFSPGKNTLFTGCLDNSLREWKVTNDAPRQNFAHPNLVDVVEFNPAGNLLATGCHDGILRLWDTTKGQVARQINAHTAPAASPVYCLAWSADGKQIATGSLDQTLKIWDAGTGNLVREMKAYKQKEFEKGHRDGVFCLAFSPDGKVLASGGSDRSIKLWNVANGQVTQELINPNIKAHGLDSWPQAHPGWVYGLRFTPDGKVLVSVGNAPRNQGYLAVWSVVDGKMLYGEELNLGPFHGVAISPDGKNLAIAAGSQGKEGKVNQGYLMKIPGVGK